MIGTRPTFVRNAPINGHVRNATPLLFVLAAICPLPSSSVPPRLLCWLSTDGKGITPITSDRQARMSMYVHVKYKEVYLRRTMDDSPRQKLYEPIQIRRNVRIPQDYLLWKALAVERGERPSVTGMW